MIIRFLILSFSYTVFSITCLHSQNLVDQELKNGLTNATRLEVNGNAKEVNCILYKLEKEADFDLLLLDYKSNYSTFMRNYYFNENGQKIKISGYIEVGNTGSDETSLRRPKIEYTYENNNLTRVEYSYADTVSYARTFNYKFDDQNQIVEIKKKETPSLDEMVEEIEYSEAGKSSTIFRLNYGIKNKTQEFLYDSNDRLSIQRDYNTKTNDYSQRELYYYDNSKVECIIFRRFGFSNSNFRGSYTKYIYNKEGFLRKTQSYRLLIKENGDDEIYRKGNLISTTIYNEKIKDDYILQTVKRKYKGEKAEIRDRFILDHKRNKIASYNPKTKALFKWKFTYFE